ncbi:family S53 protease [Dentipellis sp. KUC8613]|nr:family S53 protease [Dentipellis sp. KUC8613]
MAGRLDKAKTSIALFFLASFVRASPYPGDALHIHERRDAPPDGFVENGPAPPDFIMNLRLALVQNSIAVLEEKLYEVSTPGGPSYGQHLSKEAVEALVAPAPESVLSVKGWLTTHGVASETISPAGDWLGVNVTVAQANSLLDAEYTTFTNQATGQPTVRTLSYSIPAELKGHLDFVHPTVAFPVPIHGQPKVVPASSPISPGKNATSNVTPQPCAQQFTPACAQSLYGIPATRATQASNRLAVSGFNNEYASQADLKMFLEGYRTDLPSSTSFSVQYVDGGSNDQSNPGLEADLDIQYTVGIASGVPTTFYSVGQNNQDGIAGFLDLVNTLLQDSNAPHVLSTSYGFNEKDIPFSLANRLCNAYAQLGARGTSVLFSSGDGGVAGTQTTSCTNFVPTFPSTCPYVTSVGGTQGANPETAASLSSGGFSNLFVTPSYQTAAVNAYLCTLGTTNSGRYNSSGRAFPDLSAAAVDVLIAYKGKFGLVDGTSCSTPITASIIALLNDQLIAAGRGALGFLNPLIYANKQAFTDITSGNNPGCGSNGFPAIKGWDPVTGVGSPIYPALKTVVGL